MDRRSTIVTKSEKQRAVMLSIVGATGGVAGERLLGALPWPFIAAAAVAAIGGLFWFARRRLSTAGDDTVAQAVVIALIGAVATFGASRLYQRSALLLIVALVVAFIIGALVIRMARVKPAQQRS
jgi:hypothetical protein